MSEDMTNLGNPVNNRHDEERRDEAKVTGAGKEVGADDLFDDSPETTELEKEYARRFSNSPEERNGRD